MKEMKLLSALIILMLLLVLTNCDLLMGDDGRDGKSFLKVTIDSTVEASYVYLDVFPDGGNFNTNYEIEEGYYSGEYALCDYNYQYNSSEGDYDYFYYINSYDEIYSYGWSETLLDCNDILDDYISEDGDLISFNIYITTNEGSDGSLFKDGDDGEDNYYSLYLDWYEDDITISSNKINLEKTVQTGEDNSTIMEFKNKYKTIILTFPEREDFSKPKINSKIREVH